MKTIVKSEEDTPKQPEVETEKEKQLLQLEEDQAVEEEEEPEVQRFSIEQEDKENHPNLTKLDSTDAEDSKFADESDFIRLQDTSNLLHQTFKTAANRSSIPDEEVDEKEVISEEARVEQVDKTEGAAKMEFTKDYSDELSLNKAVDQSIGPSLIMNQSSGGPDLADFELPPYSGSSSSGSEQAVTTKQQSPAKQRKSSSSSSATQQQASSSQAQKSSSVAPPDLTAVKNLLMATYSRGSHIFHWRKPIETGVLLGIGMTLIIAITFFSIISVSAYSALGIIFTSGLIRIYKSSMRTLNRSTETPFDHIWDKILSTNVTISSEKMHELVDSSLGNLNASLTYFKQVLLVEDKLATFKFGFFLYMLTYIGSWFNGLTLITICYLSLFSVPIFYEQNKTRIDEYLNLASKQISSAISLITSKVTSLTFGSSSSASSSGAKKQD